MIDIPLGKALVAIESDCNGKCLFYKKAFSNYFYEYESCNSNFECYARGRKDGKNVIYKLVDYPVEGKK